MGVTAPIERSSPSRARRLPALAQRREPELHRHWGRLPDQRRGAWPAGHPGLAVAVGGALAAVDDAVEVDPPRLGDLLAPHAGDVRPDAGALPVAQAAPARHTAAVLEFLRQLL